jgi:fatty acid desaturase
MSLKNMIHTDARIALTRTQGRRAASWLIMAACLGAMMLLWGVALPVWVFVGVVIVPFLALIVLGNYWAGQDEAAAKAKPVSKR